MFITEGCVRRSTQTIDLIKRPMENHREVNFGVLTLEQNMLLSVLNIPVSLELVVLVPDLEVWGVLPNLLRNFVFKGNCLVFVFKASILQYVLAPLLQLRPYSERLE